MTYRIFILRLTCAPSLVGIIYNIMCAEDPQLRVCLLFESFYPVIGGGEAHGRVLAKGLADRGVRILVVTLRSRSDLALYERFEGYDIYRVGRSRNRWKGMASAYRKLRAMADYYDVIYVSAFRTLGVPAVLIGYFHRKPVVLESQNNGELSGSYFDAGLKVLGLSHRSPVFRPLNALRRTLLGQAEHFVAVAESIKREYLHHGVSQQKIILIPYGVDLARFRPPLGDEKIALRRRLRLPLGARIVCFTGRLVTWKGPLTLLEAWRQIMNHHSVRREATAASPNFLVFLGGGGSDQHNCEAEALRFVTDRGLGDSIRFEGDIDNVEDYLRAADVFAFPTTDDTFPIAVLEAMSCGLPMVVTKVAGLADYVRDEINALAVPPGEVDPVRNALSRLLADPELRERLGKAALISAQDYSRERNIERHLELFRNLARNNRAVHRYRTTDPVYRIT
jgi:glycosyltransferase involved in cell wall biosynthesis